MEGTIENGDWILSYNGTVLTGVRQWQGDMIDIPAMGYNENETLTSGYFSTGDMPTFKILKQTTGEMIQLEGTVPQWEANGIYTVSGLAEVETVPEVFGLTSAYPNPFNPVTTLSFALPGDAEVSIQVYNIQGRIIETLVERNMHAGYHTITWNADQHSSGVYFVRMFAEGIDIGTQKLLLIK